MKMGWMMISTGIAAGASLAAGGSVAFDPAADRSAAVAEADIRPPDWFLEEIALMINGQDRWITDNSPYRSDEEPWDQYGMRWRRAADGNGATGRLFGLVAGEERATFWEMRLSWDVEHQVARVWQRGGDGTVGDGTMTPSGQGAGKEAIQTFTRPDGTSFDVRHLSTTTADTHVTRSFDRVDGEWQPRREYVWRKVPL